MDIEKSSIQVQQINSNGEVMKPIKHLEEDKIENNFPIISNLNKINNDLSTDNYKLVDYEADIEHKIEPNITLENIKDEISINTIKLEVLTTRRKPKQKSPLKFPKPRIRKENPFPKSDRSRLDIWKEMCQKYETDKSAYVKEYVHDLPKFKKKQHIIYEEIPSSDEDTLIKPTRKFHEKVKKKNKSKDIKQDKFTSFFYSELMDHEPQIPMTDCSSENFYADLKEMDKFDHDKTFILPSFIKLNSNHKPGSTLPHIPFKLSHENSFNKIKTKGLDDTGASHSLIEKNYLKKIGLFEPTLIKCCNKSLLSAKGRTEEGILGSIVLNLELIDNNKEKFELTETFFIVEGLKLNIILGNSLLQDESKIVLQTPKYIIMKNQETPEKQHQIDFVHKQTNTEAVNVVTIETNTTIEPNSEKLCTIILNNAETDPIKMMGKYGLIHSDNCSIAQKQNGITVKDGISKMKTNPFGEVILEANLQNLTNEKITVFTHQILGKVENLHDLPIIEGDWQSISEQINTLNKFSEEELESIYAELISLDLPEEAQEIDNAEIDQVITNFLHLTDLPTEKIIIEEVIEQEYVDEKEETQEKDVEVYFSMTSGKGPLVEIGFDDEFKKEPAFENKRRYELETEESIAENLPFTEIRCDIDLNENPEFQSDDEFLEQFNLKHLNQEETERLENILLYAKDSFAKSKNDVGRTNLLEMEIKTPEGKYVRQKERSLGIDKLNFLRPFLKQYLRHGFIAISDSKFSSNLVLVKKIVKSSPGDLTDTLILDKQTLASIYRVAQDLRDLNSLMEGKTYPLGNPEQIIAKTMNCFCSLIDINSAYFHVAIKKSDRHKTAFYADGQLYHWCRMTQGLASAPAIYSQLMSMVFSDEMCKKLEQKYPTIWKPEWTTEGFDNFVSHFLDDIVIYSKTKEEHFEHVLRVLLALLEADLKLAGTKCEWIVTEFRLLGTDVDTMKNQIKMSNKRCQALRDLPTPSTISDVQLQLAIFNYFSKFLPRFREISYPLSRQLRTKAFTWGITEQKCYEELKELIAAAIILTLPNKNKDLLIFVDASMFACASALMQLSDDGKSLQVCGFSSKLFSQNEARLAIYHKETLALCYGLQHWSAESHSNMKKTIVFTDALGLVYLYRNKQFAQRFSLAANFLSQFLPKLELRTIKGSHNFLADLFSRAFHSMNDANRNQLYSLSRERANILPRQKSSVFGYESLMKILFEEPIVEGTDYGERRKKLTKQPLTLLQETEIFSEYSPEEKFLDLQIFTEGFKNRFPKKLRRDENITEALSPAQQEELKAKEKISANTSELNENENEKTFFNPIFLYENLEEIKGFPDMRKDDILHLHHFSDEKPKEEYVFNFLIGIQYYLNFLRNFMYLYTKNKNNLYHWQNQFELIDKMDFWTTIDVLESLQIFHKFCEFIQALIVQADKEVILACQNTNNIDKLTAETIEESKDFFKEIEYNPTYFYRMNWIAHSMSLFPIFSNTPILKKEMENPKKHVFDLRNQKVMWPDLIFDQKYINLCNASHKKIDSKKLQIHCFPTDVNIKCPKILKNNEINFQPNFSQNIIKPNESIETNLNFKIFIPNNIYMMCRTGDNKELKSEHLRNVYDSCFLSEKIKLTNIKEGNIRLKNKKTVINCKFYKEFENFGLIQINPEIIFHSFRKGGKNTKIEMENKINRDVTQRLANLREYNEINDKISLSRNITLPGLNLPELPERKSSFIDKFLNKNLPECTSKSFFHELENEDLEINTLQVSKSKKKKSNKKRRNLTEDTTELIPNIDKPPIKMTIKKDVNNEYTSEMNIEKLFSEENNEKTATENNKDPKSDQIVVEEENTTDDIDPIIDLTKESTDNILDFGYHYGNIKNMEELEKIQAPWDDSKFLDPKYTKYEEDLIFYFKFLGEKSLSKLQFIKLQEKDIKCRNEIEKICLEKTKDTPNDESFLIKQGVLLFFDTFDEKFKIVVPDCILKHIIYAIHQSSLHIRQVFPIFQKFFYNKSAKKITKQVLAKCAPCLVNAPLNPEPELGDHRSFTPKCPRECINLDLIIGLDRTKRQNVHCLSITDTFSKYVTLIALQNKDPKHVLTRFRDGYLNSQGFPRAIYSDLGTEFLAEFRNFCLQRGIRLLGTFPRTQKQNCAEFSNHLLKQRLQLFITDPEFGGICDSKNWDIFLADIASIINKSFFSSFSSTREIVHFGHEIGAPSPFWLDLNKKSTEELDTDKQLEEYIKTEVPKFKQKTEDLDIISQKKRGIRAAKSLQKRGRLTSNHFREGMLCLHATYPYKKLTPKRALARILRIFPRGALLQNCQTGLIFSSNFKEIKLISSGELEHLYPKSYLSEIKKLATDLLRRKHKPGHKLLEKYEDKESEDLEEQEEEVEENKEKEASEKKTEDKVEEEEPTFTRITTRSRSKKQ